VHGGERDTLIAARAPPWPRKAWQSEALLSGANGKRAPLLLCALHRKTVARHRPSAHSASASIKCKN
jgi:hypothetical protein